MKTTQRRIWLGMLVLAGVGLLSCGAPDLEVTSRAEEPRPIVLVGQTAVSCWDVGEKYRACDHNQPFGKGNFLAVHGAAGGVTWFAQEGALWGTMMGEGLLHREYQNDDAEIRSIFAVNTLKAWAVGRVKSTKQGLVLRWDGTSWKEVSLCERGAPGAESCAVDVGMLRRVTVVGEEVWVVGENGDASKGTVWRMRGGVWNQVTIPDGTLALHGVWGVDAMNIWAVGDNGTILRCTDNMCSKETPGTDQPLYAVGGTGADNVWAVGDNGTVLRRQNNQWTAVAGVPKVMLDSVWGVDGNNVWAAGAGGAVWKWDGSMWSSQVLPVGNVLLSGVWGVDGNNVWVVGFGGTLFHWDGAAWVNQNLATEQNLASVHGVNANNIWAVGNNGTVVHWAGWGWVPQPSNSLAGLSSVWAADASNVWAVGESKTALHWNGSMWSTETVSISPLFKGLWGTDAKNVWAVGLVKTMSGKKTGAVFQRNDTGWQVTAANVPDTILELNAMWGTDVNNILAVGSNGRAMRWDGNLWKAEVISEKNTAYMFAVWGASKNAVWAVGSGGTIVHWDGTAWSEQTSGSTQNLNGVWGTDASSVWAVGNNGTIVHWDGTAWTVLPTKTTKALNAVWGTDANNIWVVGEQGTLLRLMRR